LGHQISNFLKNLGFRVITMRRLHNVR